MRRMIGVCGAVLAISAQPARAELNVKVGAADIIWSNAYGSAGEDWINDIVTTEEGGFLAVGFLNRVDGGAPSDWRALASKFDADGAVSWTREFGLGGAIDAFWTAREREDGAFALGGLTTRVGPGGINAYVAIIASDGAILKENGYGTAGYDRITGIAPTADGFIGAGHAEGIDGRDVFLIGLDANGVEIWRRVFAEKGSNGALYVEPAGDGSFIVAGGTSPEGVADLLVMKVDARGEVIWRRAIGEPLTDEINHGLVALPDGRIVLAGYTNSWGAGEHDLMLAILSADGDILSIETIGGEGDERARSLKADSDGKLWIVGHTSSAGSEEEAILVGAAADGSFDEGVIILGGEGADVASALLPLAGGDILIGGYMGRNGAPPDAYVMRLRNVRLKAAPGFKTTKVR